MILTDSYNVRRQFECAMALAKGHEIHIVQPRGYWVVPPWITLKNREWHLMTPWQRSVLLRQLTKHMTPRERFRWRAKWLSPIRE